MSARYLLLLCTMLTFASQAADEDGSQIQPDNYYPKVKMETTMGTIVVELDRSRAPITVNNFLRYVDKRSYDGTIFHRIIADFVVQGGGYNEEFKEQPRFPPIFNESGNGMKNQMYTIAMARQNDPHSANRQFYFNLNDNESLDPGRKWGYTVFGYIVEGTDVVDEMSLVETEYAAIMGWADVPKQPVMLTKACILKQQNLQADGTEAEAQKCM